MGGTSKKALRWVGTPTRADAAEVEPETGRSSGYHAPSTQTHAAVEDHINSLREPQPGLRGGTDATTSTANEQPQQAISNGNSDSDNGSKVHPPGARQKHQQQQQQQQLQHATIVGSPHSPSAASQLPLQAGKRALHSSNSGPPPKRPTTRTDEGGGGHSVKRVGTDTLSPPHKRRSTETGPQSQ